MPEAIARYVTLKSGPLDGESMTVTMGATLSFEDPDDPTRVARYRPGRERGTYTFRGFAKVITRPSTSAQEGE